VAVEQNYPKVKMGLKLTAEPGAVAADADES
jgi:hypothetical protein